MWQRLAVEMRWETTMNHLPILFLRAGRSPESYYIDPPPTVWRFLHLRVDIHTMRTLLPSLTFIVTAFSASPPLDTRDNLPYCNGQSGTSLPVEKNPCNPQEEQPCCISFTKYASCNDQCNPLQMPDSEIAQWEHGIIRTVIPVFRMGMNGCVMMFIRGEGGYCSGCEHSLPYGVEKKILNLITRVLTR